MSPSPSRDVSQPQEISAKPLRKSTGRCLREYHDSVAAILECDDVKPNLLAAFGVPDELTVDAIQMEEDRALDARDRLNLRSEALESKRLNKIEELEKDLRKMAEGYDFVSKVVHAIFKELVLVKGRLGRGEDVSEEDCRNVQEGVEICKMAVELCNKLRDEFKKKINRLLAMEKSSKILEDPKVKKAVERLY
jgi:hypothetical protein